MASRVCPNCHQSILDIYHICPNCGSMIDAASIKHKKPKTKIIIIVAIVIAAIFIMMIFNFLICSKGNQSVYAYAHSTTHTSVDKYVSTPRITTAPTPKPTPNWVKAYYVDDFGDRTSEWCLIGEFEGTFSNSATTGSNLTAWLVVEHDYSTNRQDDSFYIRLLEYDKYPVNFIGVKPSDVTIKIKIGDQVYTGYASALSENSIHLKRANGLYKAILWSLEKGYEIKVAITVDEGITSKYQFTVNSNGIQDIDHMWNLD